jgi:Tol biopolymer transport system component
MARAGKRRAPPDGCLSCGYNDRMRLAQVLLALLLGGASLVGHVAAQASDQDKERGFLSRVRRLTVDGRRAGEGYWSPDGRRLVFQSEREPGNPFYQIYVLDLVSGETKRISPGTGKATCAFFRPGGTEIEFASTHLDPRSRQYQEEELAFRASGKERRYAWDYDPMMDIFTYDEQTGATRQLTTAKGYDAEGSFSPDGRSIVFSSTREAYSRTLAPDEQQQLERDPSIFADIYVMKADGSEQRRLTSEKGYDGGPFFMRNGDIVWRHFDESGLIADVWTMKPDGSGKTQITDFESMSWAPYEHPSGEYFFFASNKLGFDNFEIFIVDRAGTKEPVRVTFSPGFDALPVPSPDGTQLAWTSSRGSGGTGVGQIYLAQWNHEAALAALRAAPPRKPEGR